MQGDTSGHPVRRLYNTRGFVRITAVPLATGVFLIAVVIFLAGLQDRTPQHPGTIGDAFSRDVEHFGDGTLAFAAAGMAAVLTFAVTLNLGLRRVWRREWRRARLRYAQAVGASRSVPSQPGERRPQSIL